jgi:hypothetical protein
MRRIFPLAAVATSIVLAAFFVLVLFDSDSGADVAGGNGVPDVRMDQTSYNAAVSGTFDVLINITGLGVVNCSHYQFGLTYDNTLVNIIASTPDEATGCVCGLYKRGFSWYYGDPLYGAGVDCGEVGVGTPVPASPPFTDPQQVVDFTFQCLRDGEGLLAFGDIVLYDGAGNPAYVVNTGADVICGEGEPTATETPTPVCTDTPTSTPVPTSTPTPSDTPTTTPTSTPTGTSTTTPTFTPTGTATTAPTPTGTPTATSTPRHRRTQTPVPSNTPLPPTSTPVTLTPVSSQATATPVGAAGPAISAPPTGTGPGSNSQRCWPAILLLLVAGGVASAAGIARLQAGRR